MRQQQTNGCEIHRLKTFDKVDREQVERLYKVCKPYINKLSRTIDCRRFNVTPDVIQSYFWDKFMYTYHKYSGEYEEEKLKATILHSLGIYKNKLLRNAYTKQAEFNQDLVSLDGLFDNSKEDGDNELPDDSFEDKRDLKGELREFMKQYLTDDEILLFETELDPPEFFNGRVTVLKLIDFFELPRNKRSYQTITDMRSKVSRVLSIAQANFRKDRAN